jgi:hypothetical protein
MPSVAVIESQGRTVSIGATVVIEHRLTLRTIENIDTVVALTSAVRGGGPIKGAQAEYDIYRLGIIASVVVWALLV